MTSSSVPSEKSPFVGWALWISLALTAITVVVYASAWRHEFVNFDDLQYVSENPHVSGGLTWRGVSWALTTGHAGNWHPLTWVSHMLDVQLYGLNAGPHHLTSALLHTVSTILLFGLLLRMSEALGRSAFVAALFAVHPLHVESVAWVAERNDVLSTVFWMLTLWGYLGYVRQPRPRRYVVVLVLFALGLMAKPMLVTLPFVLLLLDFWPLGRLSVGAAPRGRAESAPAGERRSGPLQLIWEKLPLFAMAMASSIVTFVVQQQAGAVKGLEALPLSRRAANALVAYVAYIGKMVWPTPLAAIYPYPRSLPALEVVGAGVCLVAVSVVVIRAARRAPYLPVGWLWYLGTLVPVIGLIQVGSQPMADRYTYIPLVGLFIIVAWGVPDLLARWPHRNVALPVAAGLVVATCAIAARGQVQYWKNSVVLWEHALDVTTLNYRAHGNLAHALARRGQANEAIAHYAEALRIKPDNAEARNNLGVALAGRGRFDEAIRHFSAVLQIKPDDADAHTNLGLALTDQGKAVEAIAHYAEALRLNPGDARAHNGLGAALADQGKADEAIAHYSEAVRINPNFADAYSNLGSALARQGRVDEAIHEFLEALRVKPDEADFHYDVAVMFARRGQTLEAVQHLEAALELSPGHQAARRALDALTRRGGAPRDTRW